MKRLNGSLCAALLILGSSTAGCPSGGNVPAAASSVDTRAPSVRDPLLHITLAPITDGAVTSTNAVPTSAPPDTGMAAMPGMAATEPPAPTVRAPARAGVADGGTMSEMTSTRPSESGRMAPTSRGMQGMRGMRDGNATDCTGAGCGGASIAAGDAGATMAGSSNIGGHRRRSAPSDGGMRAMPMEEPMGAGSMEHE